MIPKTSAKKGKGKEKVKEKKVYKPIPAKTKQKVPPVLPPKRVVLAPATPSPVYSPTISNSLFGQALQHRSEFKPLGAFSQEEEEEEERPKLLDFASKELQLGSKDDDGDVDIKDFKRTRKKQGGELANERLYFKNPTSDIYKVGKETRTKLKNQAAALRRHNRQTVRRDDERPVTKPLEDQAFYANASLFDPDNYGTKESYLSLLEDDDIEEF